MKDFKEDVLSIIESMGESKEESKFWSNVYDFLRISKKGFEFEAKFLLAALLMHGSSDAVRINQIIFRYTLYSEGNYNKAHEFTTVAAATLYAEDLLIAEMENLLTLGSLQHLIYYKDDFKVLDSMHLAIENVDLDYISCLTKYKRYSRVRVEKGELRTLIYSFLDIWYYIKRDILGEIISIIEGYGITKDFLTYIVNKNRGFPDERTKIRIYFLLKVVKALILKNKNEPAAAKCAKCLRMFFQTIPEPYVTREELKSFLSFSLKDTDRMQEVTEMFMDMYNQLFDFECQMPYAPRTLKHLAKCATRESIHKALNTLQNAIKNLPLPNSLKDFLLYSESIS